MPEYRFITWGATRLENVNLFARDLVHLNKTGKEVMWRLVYDLVSKVVTEVKSKKHE